MKVLHVIPSLAARDGGPTQAMVNIERALMGAGIEIEIATTVDGRNDLVAPSHPDVLRRYFRGTTTFYKVSIGFASWCHKHIADYDLVHVHALFSFVSTTAAHMAWRSGVPYVVRPLGVLNEYGMTKRRPALKRASFRFVERPILERAAAVHFTSDAERIEAEALGCAMRSVVIPLAVAVPDRVAPPASPGPGRYVLFLSRLDPKKNVEGLLRAFALLARENGALQLVIAGDGEPDYVRSLCSLAEQLGIGARVRWPGHVTGTAKEELFQDAAAFVLPSYSENFGIAAAEALAVGVPCVLGQGVALARQVHERGAGARVAPDPTSIATGVRQVLAAGPAMRTNARALATDELSLGVMGRRLRKLYEEILAGGVHAAR